MLALSKPGSWVEGHTFFSACRTSSPLIQLYLKQKTEASDLDASEYSYVSDDANRHPYVGIIQIRLSVEGHTFLSARHTSSRLFNC